MRACRDLSDLLYSNQILSNLNISDNRVGNDGWRIVSRSLSAASPLVILNIANNELDGPVLVESIYQYLRLGRNLIELNLSSNRIGDEALKTLSETFEDSSCRLRRLILRNVKITATGVGSLFYSIRCNTRLSDLILSDNDLSGRGFQNISVMLWQNRDLKNLILSKCNLGRNELDAIGEGFKKNRDLNYLDISKNHLEPNSFD